MMINGLIQCKLVTLYANGDTIDPGTVTGDLESLQQDIDQFEQVWQDGERWILLVKTDYEGFCTIADRVNKPWR